MQEIWKQVPGYDWGLEASSTGNLRYRSGDPVRLLSVSLYDAVSAHKLGHGRTMLLVHRAVFLAFHGEIPEGLQVDHIDDNPKNNAASNLRTVTRQENMAKSWERRRAIGHTAMHRLDRHCKRGHEYTPENTRMKSDGYRYCKACEKIRYEAKRDGAA